MLMTFLPPLLAFSSRMWLDCIAQTSLGMLLEEECLCLWILTLQMGDIPLRCTKRCTVQALYCPFGFGVNYLYLGASRAFCLLLHTVCLFSRFLDERNWFIHDWWIVHMCWWRADGAGCWTPGGRRALWCVERCCCCRLCGSATAPAKCTFSPRTFRQVSCQHLNILLIWLIVILKSNLPTSPPMWDLGRGSACVWLGTQLGLVSVHWWHVWICLHSVGEIVLDHKMIEQTMNKAVVLFTVIEFNCFIVMYQLPFCF